MLLIQRRKVNKMEIKEPYDLLNTSFLTGKGKTKKGDTKMAKEKGGAGTKTIPKAPNNGKGKGGEKGGSKGGKKGC
jgi:hypothetical protein